MEQHCAQHNNHNKQPQNGKSSSTTSQPNWIQIFHSVCFIVYTPLAIWFENLLNNQQFILCSALHCIALLLLLYVWCRTFSHVGLSLSHSSSHCVCVCVFDCVIWWQNTPLWFCNSSIFQFTLLVKEKTEKKYTTIRDDIQQYKNRKNKIEWSPCLYVEIQCVDLRSPLWILLIALSELDLFSSVARLHGKIYELKFSYSVWNNADHRSFVSQKSCPF